ncbi:hypothetical protein A2U01_0053413, partial [Trifolium medium]|nr:hypothetical protein [Trifolium medium]
VMVAELWGALKGLKSAWEKGYRRVELQIDALAMVIEGSQKGSDGAYTRMEPL